MGYVITGGAGLAIGIALLIWGLVERGKRSAAEDRAAKLALSFESMSRDAEVASSAISSKDRAIAAARKEILGLEKQRNALRLALQMSRDPEIVKAWLKEELS